MILVYRKLSELKLYEDNPRNNEKTIKALARSIRQFGFKVPLVIDMNNVIICGHTRYKASEYLGLDEVPCILACELNDEQIKAFRLIDNKTQEYSLWDYTKLAQELKIINDDEIMEVFGFTNNIMFDSDEINLEFDMSDVDTILDGYEEPEHKKCKCPKCGHIDRIIHFKKIKIEKPKKEEEKDENIS